MRILEAGHGDDFDSRKFANHQLRQFHSASAGHMNIGKDDMDRVPPQKVEGAVGVGLPKPGNVVRIRQIKMSSRLRTMVTRSEENISVPLSSRMRGIILSGRLT